MVNRYNKGIGANTSSSSDNLDTRNNNKFSVPKRSWVRRVLLATGIPFAALSVNTAEASANSLLDKLNPISPETQGKLDNIVNETEKVIEWFKNFKANITEMSVDLMVWSYDTIASVVLHTPLFLFDSEWFKNNVLMFTGLSIAMSIVLAMYEGFHRMLGHFFSGKRKPNPASSSRTDMARISRRIPLVVIGSALTPACFYYGFKAINWLTNVIIDIGKNQMDKGIGGIKFDSVSWVEMFAFVAFDIALITMMIPVLLQNFRRWFDLMALGALTPLALSCWVFKDHEHFFHTWWENIKKNSLTQLSYAVFLLIIGSMMFATGTPDSGGELAIKLGIIIGGLMRMNNPPNLMRRYVDTGASASDMWKGASKSFDKDSMFGKGVKLVRRIRSGKVVTGGATT